MAVLFSGSESDTLADIHPRLLDDCFLIGRTALSHVLLMNDSQYPWIILVPDRDGVSEVFELSDAEQAELARDSSALSRHMSLRLGADKMNVAALGNVVPQLHIHHIARFTTDVAWPRPVWGVHSPQAYDDAARAELLDRLKLPELCGFLVSS